MMRPVTLAEVLSFIDHFEGSGYAQVASAQSLDFTLTGFAPIVSAGEYDVSFWTGDSSVETGLFGNAGGVTAAMFESVRAGLLFVPKAFAASVEGGATKAFPNVKFVCGVENPYHAMVQFLEHFATTVSQSKPHIPASAKVHPSAVVEGCLGENVVVGPGCVVMADSEVGDGSVLEANVTIYSNVKIGRECVFQAGSVVGSRGYGFYMYAGERRMVPHLAGVVIGDGCSFGANSVVAAGFITPTKIGNHCHFDSFVQIAHNCCLGDNIMMASQSGLAGSVTVGDNVELAGGAQSAGHLTIGSGAKVAAKAGITKNIPENAVYAGFPAEDIAVWRRSVVRLRQMGKK